MTLLDAKQYDPRPDLRRRRRIVLAIIVLLLVAAGAYHLRNHAERATVRKFFSYLQKQDYERAYAVWFQDPNWKQHPTQYSSYPFNDFYRDWGPSGEWGQIKSYSVDCSFNPGGSGVIVQATVNQRAEHAYVWVQKSDKTLSFSPNEIECGNWWAWLTE